MRRLFDGGHPITDLSRKYHVHREVASRICNRKTYVDVRDDLGTILPPPPVPETDLVEVAARRLSGARSRSLSEKQYSNRYASLMECKDANYSTTKSTLL